MTNENRDSYIFKKIKEHFNEIKDKYEVVGVFLQGSQNYGLDIYDDDYTSDVDTKAIILPTLKDIVKNAQPVSTTIVRDNNEHIDVKDIRIMFDTFKKQNINFIEILFTRYCIVNPKYKDLWQKVRDIREDIAYMDFNRALNAQYGMSEQKFVALKHPYPTIVAKIEKYGYDPKQLHHIVRMNDFIKKYIRHEKYEDCLIPDDKQYLISLKKGVLPLQEAEDLAKKTNINTYELAKKEQKDYPTLNVETSNQLDNIKLEFIERYLRETLQDKTTIKTPKQYKNIFVTSDIHFFHKNILKFENRPFASIEEMNERIISNWNSVVGKDDLVYILGDISFGSIKDTNLIISRLNGYKVLIVGNHDTFVNNKKFDKTLFCEITGLKEVNIYGKDFIMCHYPFASGDDKKIQLYGHIHSNKGKHRVLNLPQNSYNVCMDMHDLFPINIKQIIAELDDREKPMTDEELTDEDIKEINGAEEIIKQAIVANYKLFCVEHNPYMVFNKVKCKLEEGQIIMIRHNNVKRFFNVLKVSPNGQLIDLYLKEIKNEKD